MAANSEAEAFGALWRVPVTIGPADPSTDRDLMARWIDDAWGFDKDVSPPVADTQPCCAAAPRCYTPADRSKHMSRLSRPRGLRRGGKVLDGRRGPGRPRPSARSATAPPRPTGSWSVCARLA